MSLEFIQVAALAALTLASFGALLRLIARQEWRPMPPAALLAVLALCLTGAAGAVEGAGQSERIDPTFWLWLWNGAVAFFDLQMTLVLARRGEIEPPGRFVRRIAGL